jgi:hypothetical protein
MFLPTVVVVELALGAKTFAATSGRELANPSAEATLKMDPVRPAKMKSDRQTFFICMMVLILT